MTTAAAGADEARGLVPEELTLDRDATQGVVAGSRRPHIGPFIGVLATTQLAWLSVLGYVGYRLFT